jgi:hypothetical protein
MGESRKSEYEAEYEPGREKPTHQHLPNSRRNGRQRNGAETTRRTAPACQKLTVLLWELQAVWYWMGR